MSWFNESEKHAQARLGIKTSGIQEVKAPPRLSPEKGVVDVQLGDAMKESSAETFDEIENNKPSGAVSKQKLSGIDNSLQTHVHKFGHLVRNVRNRGVASKEDIVALVSEYDQARLRALEYYSAQGSLPYWSGKDWVGKENWQDGGSVKRLLDRVVSTKDNEQKMAIEELSRSINRFGV